MKEKNLPPPKKNIYSIFLNFFFNATSQCRRYGVFKKKLNRTQKMLIIGPDPFIPQSSPGHSPKQQLKNCEVCHDHAENRRKYIKKQGSRKAMQIIQENYNLERKMAKVDRAHLKAMTELATIKDALEIKKIQRCNILGKILCLHCTLLIRVLLGKKLNLNFLVLNCSLCHKN